MKEMLTILAKDEEWNGMVFVMDMGTGGWAAADCYSCFCSDEVILKSMMLGCLFSRSNQEAEMSMMVYKRNNGTNIKTRWLTSKIERHGGYDAETDFPNDRCIISLVGL
jgi:hypothetical protein